MRRKAIARGLMLTALAVWAVSADTVTVTADDEGKKVAIRDDCDPDDPAYDPTGGCELKDGDVTFAEFFAESDLASNPGAASVIGHLAWRNDPSYLKIKEGQTVKVRNKGGRAHTFTKVRDFGGGRIPPLNKGLAPAPECVPPTATSVDLPPGAKEEVSGLAEGNHRFQCCIHPWMRALIKVEAEDENEDENED